MKEEPVFSTEKSFRAHLATWVVFSVFFFLINLLTSRDSWWFYWPMLGWGVGLAMHGIRVATTGGADTLAKTARNLQTRGATSTQQHAPTTAAAPSSRESSRPTATVEQVEERVARLWRMARSIPVPSAREKAFAVCAAADRVAEVLAADRRDPETASWFIETYVKPAESLLQGYARIASRGVAGADATLAKVEEHDLPMLEEQIDKVYQQLHRGDLVDLEVTSEMLELSLPDQIQPPTASARERTSTA